MKTKEQLLAIHAEIAKLNKKTTELKTDIDVNQRFISGAFIIVMILEVGGWIFV
jgi:hypothetical protein